MSPADFENISFHFKTYANRNHSDPKSDDMIDLSFGAHDFVEVHDKAAENLLKLAANSTINESPASTRAKELSLRY